MERRSFLKAVGGVTGSLALGVQPALSADTSSSQREVEKVAGLPRRVLGRTGQKVSIVGFPGLALTHYEQDECNKGIRDAFEKGINYYDVAPAYGRDGDCEKKMGIGLLDVDRSKIFLACKTKMRDKAGALKELDRSLKRLKTNHFDLYQLHHLRTPEEVKKALGPGGAMETILKAKEQGKIRYIGFSAHTTKGALEAMRGFRFDTVMFPINFVEMHKIGFGKAVLELAAEQGAAVLAIKAMSKGPWPQGAERTRKWWYRSTETQDETNAAMRYTLSQKQVVAGIPPSFLDLLDLAIEAGRTYKPITDAEITKLKETAQTCLSLFQREEDRVARGESLHRPIYPDSPHECCPCAYA
ncbi:MAG: aldo/keto reductase [Planctomycetota bacterium]|jgi:predicted aldo/keto reductase-like oxidoreductase